MALTSYAEARPWAAAIREAVLTGKMPPWSAKGPTAHSFRNDRSLTDAEKQILAAWAQGGAPEGAHIATSFPPARGQEGWKLGKPDVVVRVPGFTVPATGLLTYRYLIEGDRFPRGVWIRAAEWRIDQRSAVHHVNAYIRAPGSSYLAGYPKGRVVTATVADRARRNEGERLFDRRQQIVGWEPGYEPMPWTADGAKWIPAGSDIVFEIHYSPNGHEVTDHSELGLYFAARTPEERVVAIDTLRDLDLAIPPGDPDYVSHASMTLGGPVKLLSIQPHMHYRGSAMSVQAIYPDGRVEPLISVPKYDFNWQTTYVLREPKLLPKGTRLESVAHFDNSVNNPANPDPKALVHWGDQTVDEMHIAFLELAMPVADDPENILLGPPRMIGTPPPSAAVQTREQAKAEALEKAMAAATKYSFPINYDEARAGGYTLPDPLVLANGTPVRDAATWYSQRRPEILRLIEDNQYGRSPGRPSAMVFDVFEKGTPAFGGKALRKQVTVYFSGDRAGPKMDLLVYTPAAARGPVPLLLNIGFSANSNTVDDPGIKPGEIWTPDKKRVPATQGRSFGKIDVARLIDRGYGFATLYYGDIDPDFDGGVPFGVRALYLKPGRTAPEPDEWGTIAAWAWGLSRALDYLETDSAVDAKRVALMGVSRLGKTVVWAGARDPRFALVIASCSGEGGAALSKRNYGETVKALDVRYGYQFAANYQQWGDHVAQMPFDAHMLLSLIAPRPILLQTGDTDLWSDPRGEFLAAVAAGPVFRLLGKQGLGTDVMPPAAQPIMHTLGYYEHEGGHGTIPSDWDQFLAFMDMHLHPANQ